MAEARRPPHGVHVVNNYLPAQTCAEWVKHLDAQPRMPLGVHSVEKAESTGLVKERISGRVTDRVILGEIEEALVSFVQQAFVQAIGPQMGREVEWFENPQVLRYEAGGLYGPHSDSDHFLMEEGVWKKVIDRDISLLLYLNQDFAGGELAFPQFNYFYRPSAGDLLFFPSSGQYAHQALPVKSGIRYVIVSWAAWRNEPRVLDMRPVDCIEIPP